MGYSQEERWTRILQIRISSQVAQIFTVLPLNGVRRLSQNRIFDHGWYWTPRSGCRQETEVSEVTLAEGIMLNLRREHDMLVISLCFDHHKLQHLLLDHLHKQFHLIGIDLVQIRSPLVRNRTIPVLLGLEKGKIASSFWNEGIPDPDQIGSGDGCISGCGIETGWRWSRMAFPILDNQHNSSERNWRPTDSRLDKDETRGNLHGSANFTSYMKWIHQGCMWL